MSLSGGENEEQLKVIYKLVLLKSFIETHMKLYEEPQKIIKAFFCDATAVYE